MNEASANFEVVVVGAGFSGLLCTNYLKKSGIDSIRVFEMTPSVGGVWANGGVGSYPGAACDVPSYAYLPLLDQTGFIPTKKYVSQPEISAYAELLTDHVGIRDCIRFSRKVIEARYLDDDKRIWQITTVDTESGEDIEVVTCKHFVSANGPLSSPRLPEFGGMESFNGESFHTAQWDKSADLSGKRVGIIGTGASAAQVITSIADQVESLHVFQRTPTWALPREDELTPDDVRSQFHAGGYGELLRKAMGKGNIHRENNSSISTYCTMKKKIKPCVKNLLKAFATMLMIRTSLSYSRQTILFGVSESSSLTITIPRLIRLT